MTDGRWMSEASMRVYLDAVAAEEQLADPVLASRWQQIDWIEQNIASWLPW